MSKAADLSTGTAPKWTAVDVSSSDVTPTENVIGFFVGGAGDIVVVSNGETLTIPATAGLFFPGQFSKFVSSGTTATNIFYAYI